MRLIAPAVGPLLRRRAVEGAAIGLDDQAEVGPVEVDLEPFTYTRVSGFGSPARRAIERKRRSSAERVKVNVRRSMVARSFPTPGRGGVVSSS
jgi:hypothetical protein